VVNNFNLTGLPMLWNIILFAHERGVVAAAINLWILLHQKVRGGDAAVAGAASTGFLALLLTVL